MGAGSGVVEWVLLAVVTCWAVRRLVRARREARGTPRRTGPRRASSGTSGPWTAPGGPPSAPAGDPPRTAGRRAVTWRRPVVLAAHDDARCSQGHAAHVEVLRTHVSGAAPVRLVLCARCDRLRCARCRQPLTASASRCSCGTWLPEPADRWP